MPLFKKCQCNGCDPSSCGCRCHGFIRRNRIVRKLAALAGTLVGIYFLGAAQGWWERFLF
jgi:hypothetical protein